MKSSKDSIACVVVLFNPQDEVFENISSYLNQIAVLFVVDNSSVYNVPLVHKLSSQAKVIYLDNHGNKGIASALNLGANAAINAGFKLLLTMDQDTKLKERFVITLLDGLLTAGLGNTGIVAPRYDTRLPISTRYKKVLFVMTSGNILNLDAYQYAGPFLDGLFIDHVDHEYCLRLNSRGFDVIQLNDLQIIHKPGNEVTFSFLWFGFRFVSHNPGRLYYFCRNGFYVSTLYRKNYGIFYLIFIMSLIKEMVKILFENQRGERLKMILNGVRDFRSGKLGPMQS